MKIRKLIIERFRGVNQFEWFPNADILCLVGSGDSTKSTILDAIEFVLSSRWNISFEDTDFYRADTSQPIEIKATIGELPEQLLKDSKFGLLLQGLSAEGNLHDEPENTDEKILTVRLRVDASLEPSWTVMNERDIEGKPISARDRELFSTARLGTIIDRHLTWGRGSILTRLTGEVKEAPAILANVIREVKKSLKPSEITSVKSAVETSKIQAKKSGVHVSAEGYSARLDLQAQHIGLGCLTLHDGEIPLRNLGFGSRRLLAIALQRESARRGGITLIDEVEHGLEPHRLRHLLSSLTEKHSVTTENLSDSTTMNSQVFMTTHSPVPIVSLSAENIQIIRSTEGRTTITPVPSDLQNIVRKAPEAFLAKKVLVCEGKTELGLCWALDNYWQNQGLDSFTYLGIVPVNGGGSDSPQTVKNLINLGYDVCLLVDSDVTLSPSEAELIQSGVTIVQWAGSCSIEERIFEDLPDEGIKELVKWIGNEKSIASITQSIVTRTSPQLTLLENPDIWTINTNLRQAIGKTAKEKEWFKRLDLGQEMGDILCKYLTQLAQKDTGQKIKQLKRWVFGNDDSSMST